MMRDHVSGRSWHQFSGAVPPPPPMIPDDMVERAKERSLMLSPYLYFLAISSGVSPFLLLALAPTLAPLSIRMRITTFSPCHAA